MSQLSFTGAGLFFSNMADRARGMVDGKLRFSEDAARIAETRILAEIPEIPPRRNEMARALISHYDPNSPAATAFRRIAASMVPFHSILLTSCHDGEGRSFTASNLAVALANAGRKTILLDADFEFARQHEFFGLQNGRGLADILTTDSAAVWSIQKTDIKHLKVLTAGTEPVGAIPLASWMKLLQQLNRKFDHIIIDGPSMLSFPGTAALAMRSDVTLPVVRAGKTRSTCLDKMTNLLQRARAHVTGIVFNGA